MTGHLEQVRAPNGMRLLKLSVGCILSRDAAVQHRSIVRLAHVDFGVLGVLTKVLADPLYRAAGAIGQKEVVEFLLPQRLQELWSGGAFVDGCVRLCGESSRKEYAFIRRQVRARGRGRGPRR